MLVKLEHPEKHKEPKDVTEDGIVMLVKLEQFMKQLEPKDVTEEGIVMLVKLEQKMYLLLVDYQYYTF